jgi:hypothetical protein
VSAFYGRRPTAGQLAALRSEDPAALARAELAERPIEPATLARREGDAWLLVRYGRDLTERIAFLQALHVTRIALAPGRG